ncbi:MAG: glycosyltransferase family 39 protein [Patescibacteria group bacterium]|nr:glycosyltransferase family 39 protein [Patescibacteria group bacterium]
MKQVFQHGVLLVACASAVFFVNLGAPRLWDRDEPRNAGCTVEMLERNDWVVPWFNDELRDHKPVLLYWFMMTAYGVFGVNEFAARFWSAALGVGAVLATYLIGRRLLGSQVGLWGGIVLSSTLMFSVAARAATPDSVLIFFFTASLLVYVLATFRPLDEGDDAGPQPRVAGQFFPASWPAVALMYALMGMAVLAKGPAGLILPTAVIGMFLLIMRLPERTDLGAASRQQPWWRAWLVAVLRPWSPLHFLRTCWSMRPLTALAASLAVALPWYVWVGYRTDGAWLQGFFFKHNLERAMAPMEGHAGPIVFYPIALLIGFLPWSVFAVPVLVDLVRRLRRSDPWKPSLIFLVCWTCVVMGIFSLARTKLPSYITPVYPAVAILFGSFVVQWKQGAELSGRFWGKASFVTLGVVGLLMLIGLSVASWFLLPGAEWLGAIGLIPLAGAAFGCHYVARNEIHKATGAMAISSILLTLCLVSVVSTRADRHQTFHVLLDAIDARSATPIVASYGCLEPSWVFYGGRPIRELPATPEAAAAFLAASEDHFVITTDRVHSSLEGKLPPDAMVLAETPYFFKNRMLLLLGRRGPAVSPQD